MEAAVLHRKICDPARGESSAKPPSLNTHPLNKTGSKVMLTPVNTDGEAAKIEVLYGVIAGHDHLIDSSVIKHKILVLLDNKEEDEESQNCAFWATVNADGTVITDIAADAKHSFQTSYKIDMHEYSKGSEAYNACEAVLTYMKNHQRSGPFSVPVDPVALQLPGKVAQLPLKFISVGHNFLTPFHFRLF